MWTDDTIKPVLERLRSQGSDDGKFEAKSCTTSIGASVWESVSAFANTSGGTMLLGISEQDGFRPIDGFDADRVINQFMDGIGDGNPQGIRLTNPPTYRISRCQANGKPFLAVDINENPADRKPCYITAKGPSDGGYRRADDKDIRLSRTEVFELQNAMVPSRADREIVPEANLTDLNDDAVEHLLDIHKDSKALRGTTTRQERLARLNITDKQGNILLAGLLAAGQYPQQYFPNLVIDVAAYPETEKSAPVGPRFIDRTICDGNMPEAINQAVEATARNLRSTTFVVGSGAQTDAEIPREVLREVIANAVIHREYDARFVGTSICVDIYPNRVEVSNPGGLWGGVTVDNIADGISRCRNETLVRLMHEIPYGSQGLVTVEGGGTGIPLVIQQMRSRALGAPKFVAKPDRFTVVLNRYGAEYQDNKRWLTGIGTTLTNQEQSILMLLRQTSTMTVRQLHASLRIDSDDIRHIMERLATRGIITPTGPDEYAVATPQTGIADDKPTSTDKLSSTEQIVLASLSTETPLDVHAIVTRSGKGISTVRRVLRMLIVRNLAVATAPPSSKHRKYLRASSVNTDDAIATDR